MHCNGLPPVDFENKAAKARYGGNHRKPIFQFNGKVVTQKKVEALGIRVNARCLPG